MIERAIKKSKKGDKIFYLFFLIVISLSIVFLSASIIRIIQKRNNLNKEIEEIKKTFFSLQEKKKQLEGQLAKIKTEAFWEEKIRQEGYIKKGENPVVILKPENLNFQKSESQIELPKTQNFLEKIKNFFKIIFEKL